MMETALAVKQTEALEEIEHVAQVVEEEQEEAKKAAEVNYERLRKGLRNRRNTWGSSAIL